MKEEISEYPNSMTNPKDYLLRLLSYFFILLGLSVSIYLFYKYLSIAKATSGGRLDLCSTIFGKGCDNALQSSVSMQLGLPLSGWGIIFYVFLILLLLVPSIFGSSFKPESKLFIYLITLVGLLAAITLLMVMLINTSLFCPFCSVIHTINIILFFLLNYISGYSFKKLFQESKTVKSIFRHIRTEPKVRWKLFGFFTTCILVGSLYFSLRILTLSANQNHFSNDSKIIIAEYESQSVQDIPVYDDDPMDGHSDSLIRVVVFSDFYCPGCRKFSTDLSRVIKNSKGKYQVVFKHFPLCSDCNPAMKKNLHPLACEAALAAEAANKQGKFWAFHDSLFVSDPVNEPAEFRSIAQKIGLDLQQFDDYVHSKEAMQKVERSIQIGIKLGIEVTPSVFLNGRHVNGNRLGILDFLIDYELKGRRDSTTISH